MFPETLNDLEKTVIREYGNTAGMIVLKRGKKEYEKYFNDCTSADPIHICSATKSIISILIGIAIDKGYIESVKQKVPDFFPGYMIKRGEKTIRAITIENLLTMTAPYKFRSAPYTKVFSSVDWVRASLDLLGGKKPIGEFRYMEMIGPDILSGILVNATGRSVLDFARQYLFSPLDITVKSNIVLYTREQHISFIKTKPASGWVADESGTNTAGWGLTLTAADMAKIGQLCLDGGKWEGRQIVSAGWIRESTKEHSRWKEKDLPYGYLWWTGIGGAYAAIGNSGNLIYVNPGEKLVVSIASLFKPTTKDIIALIEDHIEPIFAD